MMRWRARPRRRSGAKIRVGRSDLIGVDQGLAVEAELAALAAGGGEAVVVGEVEMHAVERREAMGARRQQHEAERGQQRQPVARLAGVQILGEVGGADDQRADARAGGGDVGGGEHAERRLDHAPDRKLGRRAERVEQVERQRTRSAFSTLGSSTASIGRVAAAARSAWPQAVSSRVDPQDQLARRIAAGVDAPPRPRRGRSPWPRARPRPRGRRSARRPASARAFSSARGFEPGMNSTLRRGRIGAGIGSSVLVGFDGFADIIRDGD